MNLPRYLPAVLTGLVILMLINLFLVDYIIFKIVLEEPKLVNIEASVLPPPTPTSVSQEQLTRSDVEAIVREETRLFKPQTSIPTPKSTVIAQQAGGGSQVKEFFIHLGSGSGSTEDWTDVSGVEAYIDSTKYGRIKEVIFEASVNIPTGNQVVYIRLYNITDKHPVWFSEVSHEGGGSILLISKPITLDSGSKLYRVQMKTSLKYLANLSSARVKITVE